ncbi:hypothetical protein FRC12_016636, partial [Ceratobasidium sp. 428]
ISQSRSPSRSRSRSRTPQRRGGVSPKRGPTRRTHSRSRSATPLRSSSPAGRKRRRTRSRSPTREREDEPDAGVNVQPLSIKGAAETAKRGRWEAEDDDKTANARIESELRENLLRQKVMKTRKGRRGSEAE